MTEDLKRNVLSDEPGSEGDAGENTEGGFLQLQCWLLLKGSLARGDGQNGKKCEIQCEERERASLTLKNPSSWIC